MLLLVVYHANVMRPTVVYLTIAVILLLDSATVSQVSEAQSALSVCQAIISLVLLAADVSKF
jgi:hypothetical protein